MNEELREIQFILIMVCYTEPLLRERRFFTHEEADAYIAANDAKLNGGPDVWLWHLTQVIEASQATHAAAIELEADMEAL